MKVVHGDRVGSSAAGLVPLARSSCIGILYQVPSRKVEEDMGFPTFTHRKWGLNIEE